MHPALQDIDETILAHKAKLLAAAQSELGIGKRVRVFTSSEGEMAPLSRSAAESAGKELLKAAMSGPALTSANSTRQNANMIVD